MVVSTGATSVGPPRPPISNILAIASRGKNSPRNPRGFLGSRDPRKRARLPAPIPLGGYIGRVRNSSRRTPKLRNLYATFLETRRKLAFRVRNFYATSTQLLRNDPWPQFSRGFQPSCVQVAYAQMRFWAILAFEKTAYATPHTKSVGIIPLAPPMAPC